MRTSLALLLVLSCALLIGCATAEPEANPQAAAGGMGMGAGDGVGMLAGAVAAEKSASLDLGRGASTPRGVRVSEVLAPSDGWIVVRSATAPGSVLGKTWVRKGLSRDVEVELAAAESAEVRVALHVDQGSRQAFEFDPTRPEFSLDKPVVVARKALEERLTLTSFGVEAVANSVLLLVEDQSIRDGELNLGYLLLPAPAWVSVRQMEGGLPGKQVGLMRRPAGESQEVRVPVGDVGSGELIVTVHADRGRSGVFEYSAYDPLASLDQPFKSAGVVVSQRISVR